MMDQTNEDPGGRIGSRARLYARTQSPRPGGPESEVVSEARSRMDRDPSARRIGMRSWVVLGVGFVFLIVNPLSSIISGGIALALSLHDSWWGTRTLRWVTPLAVLLIGLAAALWASGLSFLALR